MRGPKNIFLHSAIWQYQSVDTREGYQCGSPWPCVSCAFDLWPVKTTYVGPLTPVGKASLFMTKRLCFKAWTCPPLSGPTLQPNCEAESQSWSTDQSSEGPGSSGGFFWGSFWALTNMSGCGRWRSLVAAGTQKASTVWSPTGRRSCSSCGFMRGEGILEDGRLEAQLLGALWASRSPNWPRAAFHLFNKNSHTHTHTNVLVDHLFWNFLFF